MRYITLSEMSETIRKNIWKIPRDIDFIVGVPRSGMIAASIIASFLNVPLIDVNSFLEGKEPWGGGRLAYFKRGHVKTNKVLVLDDTVYNGTSMNGVKERVKKAGIETEIIYGVVYLEGPAANVIDLYLEDVRAYTNNFNTIVFYEWNLLQHHEHNMLRFMFDMDGVLCVDPPDERNDVAYLEYIKNAVPLFIPQSRIGAILTYRLIKNKKITMEWLEKNGVKYNNLFMFNANSWEERNATGISPAMFKGNYYKDAQEYMLFVESDDSQARVIAEISKKPVYCVSTNKLYQ